MCYNIYDNKYTESQHNHKIFELITIDKSSYTHNSETLQVIDICTLFNEIVMKKNNKKIHIDNTC